MVRLFTSLISPTMPIWTLAGIVMAPSSQTLSTAQRSELTAGLVSESVLFVTATFVTQAARKTPDLGSPVDDATVICLPTTASPTIRSSLAEPK